jgi:hypothetical protein
VTIAVFGLIFLVLILRKAKETTKQLVISVGMLVLIFVIALNSGGYYSDDFIMFLAVIALTGLYLEPKYSYIQLTLATIALAVMYVLNPGKADPLPQYIQCLGEFVLTGVLFTQTIKRGKAFIGIGGITESGVTDFHIGEARLHRQLIENARQAVVLADSSKLGIRAMNNVCGLQEIDAVVTDSKAPRQIVRALEQAGVRVILAKA